MILTYFLPFYGDLVYKFKRIVGKSNFSDQFKKVIKRYTNIGYNMDIKRRKLNQGSKAALLLCIFFILCLSLPYCLLSVVTCYKKADFLALLYVMVSCVLVTFPYGILG